jgi:hypothetical protein
VFVGSYPYPHPEWPYRDELINWLQRTYGSRFKRYGPVAETVRNEALNDLYASAGVVVGDSVCLGMTHRNYWSDRLTETLGRGGVLIWPNIPGCLKYMGLRNGVHLLSYGFGDFDWLRILIDGCLADPVSARRMANFGQQHIRAKHTYTHRMRALLETVGLKGES